MRKRVNSGLWSGVSGQNGNLGTPTSIDDQRDLEPTRQASWEMKVKYRSAITLLAYALAGLWLTPISAEDLSQQTGKELYQRLCAACHGENG